MNFWLEIHVSSSYHNIKMLLNHSDSETTINTCRQELMKSSEFNQT